jgi:hypothetical protein
MTDNLMERLRKKGFKIETYELFEDAADRIEKLEAALREIAANACCDSCREAALVARKALEEEDD